MDGIAEIDGIPQPVLRAFSTRRAQIEQALAEMGRHDHRAARRACLTTRPSKTHQPMPPLRERWAARALELGFTPEQAARLLGPRSTLTFG